MKLNTESIKKFITDIVSSTEKMKYELAEYHHIDGASAKSWSRILKMKIKDEEEAKDCDVWSDVQFIDLSDAYGEYCPRWTDGTIKSHKDIIGCVMRIFKANSGEDSGGTVEFYVLSDTMDEKIIGWVLIID